MKLNIQHIVSMCTPEVHGLLYYQPFSCLDIEDTYWKIHFTSSKVLLHSALAVNEDCSMMSLTRNMAFLCCIFKATIINISILTNGSNNYHVKGGH